MLIFAMTGLIMMRVKLRVAGLQITMFGSKL